MCYGRTHCAYYNGAYYSTLADVALTLDYKYCQNYYISLPSYWIISPDNADSITVIAAFDWSTDVVITSSGLGYGAYTYSAGNLYSSSSYLITDGAGSYYTSLCSSQILIKQ